MKAIKNFFTTIDIFGFTYNFRYKNREKFQTALGGVIILLFLVLVCVMGIYYFIPFINRKNYTIVYYTMNLAETEEVNLFESESNFAVGLTCEANKKEFRQINEILDLKARYVLYIKSRDGTYEKDATQLVTHKCTYDDFYNKFDKQMDYLNVGKFECVADKTVSIQGIYADRVFSYFEFSVIAKNGSRELTEEIERFLFNNDCKLQFVYTDIIIDLDNYDNPQTQYLNELFIQLNPTLFIKRNIYFMNQYFTNDNYLMFVFGDDEGKKEIKPLYSRYEEYALYKGLNRYDTQPEEYDYYTKIYVRAELKRTIIKRKYQKFMEFYADASSLLVALYEILVIIFNYFDNFYANHALAKTIFFFKDLEEENTFNVNKKKKKIEELLYMTDSCLGINNSIEFDSKGSKINKYYPRINKDSEREKVFENDENKEDYDKDVKIYNKKKNPVDNKPMIKDNEIEDKKEIERMKTNKLLKSQKNSNDNTNSNSNKMANYLKDKENMLDNDESHSKYRMNQLRSSKYAEAMMNFKYKPKEVEEFSESMGTNMEEQESSSESEPKKKRKKKIIKAYNSFNIFEIIITEFLKCCRSRKMEIKSDANEKANNILFKKLDVISYVRNMILFDIINQINLNNSNKTVINFLCRPIISLEKSQRSEFDEFYKNYKEKDFKKFSDEIKNITEKQERDEKDNKIISISNEHLRVFV